MRNYHQSFVLIHATKFQIDKLMLSLHLRYTLLVFLSTYLEYIVYYNYVIVFLDMNCVVGVI